MLRVNLLEDATFRADLIKMAGGILRGIAEDAIREKLGFSSSASRRFCNHPSSRSPR